MSPDFSRRDLFRKAGLGVGAMAAGRLLGAAAPALAVPAPTPVGLHAVATLKLANVRLRTVEDHLAMALFDDTHFSPGPGLLELLLWPGDQAKLDALGLDYEITCDDVVARDTANQQRVSNARPANVPEAPGERTAYRKAADYNADMTDLATRYPDIVRMFALPNTTLEGRIVYGIEVAANVARNDGRPVMHMDGCHHSREWPAGEMPMMFAYDLIEGYGKDARTTSLLERCRFIFVPVMNIDGFIESREAAVDNSATGVAPIVTMAYWRKNRRSFTGVTIPQIMKNPDAYGVDPNRNYSYQWGDSDGGSSSTQTDETHRGSAPFSEPESRNIRSLVLSRQTTGMLTHHTHGRLCMRPWGWTWDDSPDELMHAELGDQMVSHNGYTNQKAIGLYLTSGGSRCWTYGTTGATVYTFEHGSAFHPAYASTIPAMYNLNREPFFLLSEAAADPSTHCVIRGKLVDGNGQGVAGTVAIGKTLENPAWLNGNGAAPGGVQTTEEVIATSMDTEADGSFVYHVNPSRRLWLEGAEDEVFTVTFSAEGKAPVAQEVKLDRGDDRALGDIPLA